MCRNLLAHGTLLPHAHIRQMFRILRVILPLFPFLLQFIPDDALLTMKLLRNRPDRISLVPQDLDFSSIDVRDMNPFYSFFILLFYPSRSNFKDKLPRLRRVL